MKKNELVARWLFLNEEKETCHLYHLDTVLDELEQVAYKLKAKGVKIEGWEIVDLGHTK